MNFITHKNYFELRINILKLIMSLSFFNMIEKKQKWKKKKKEKNIPSLSSQHRGYYG